MQRNATSTASYLAGLPADRRAELETVLKVIRASVIEGFEEGIQYGMIGWYVPHRLYPAGYHCNPAEPLPFVHLAAQKNHLALYMMCLYTDSAAMERFRAEWAATGKKLDMGKSCIRFKKAAGLALDVIGGAISRITVKQFIEHYEAGRPKHRK